MVERLRIVIEATLTGQELDWVLTDRGRYKVGNYGVTEIEVIPAPFVLPTKRWAQVVDSQNFLWTRVHQEDELSIHYQWVSLGGKIVPSWKLLKLSGLRVVSEGILDDAF
jgi:hypothetical protein